MAGNSPPNMDSRRFVAVGRTKAEKSLHQLIFAGDSIGVKRLLDAGVSPNSAGWSVRAQSAAVENEDIASSLRSEPPSSLGQSSFALSAAAQVGNLEICSSLIEAGAKIDQPDESDSLKGMTPLMVAAEAGHLPVVKLLIEKGCDIFLRDKPGRTAVIAASEQGHQEIAEFIRAEMLNRSKEWNLADAALNGLLPKVKELLAAGCSPNQVDEAGVSALSYACHYYYIGIADALIDARADLSFGADFKNAKDQRIQTRVAEQLEFVEPPNGKFSYARSVVGGITRRSFLMGEPPILAACGTSAIDIVQSFIKAGADVNICSTRGNITPLMMAIKARNLALVQLLIDSGANIMARDAAGATPLEWAKQEKKFLGSSSEVFNIIELLQSLLGYEKKPLPDFKQAWKDFKEVEASKPFKDILELLTSLCQSKPYPWKKRKGVYRFYPKDWDGLAKRFNRPADYVSSAKKSAKHERKEEVTRLLQSEIRQAGFLLVSHKDEEGAPMQLLFPTLDKFAVIAACGTDGENYGLSTYDIIETLQEIDEKYPFVITDCMHDAVGGQFVNPPEKPLELAQLLYEFCTDLIDGERVSSTEDIAKYISETNRFYLWWD